MKNNTEPSCPKCGTPIPEEAPQGLCPKCVLAGAATIPVSSSGRGTPPPALEEVAAQFPDLEILELIGSGGMGAVYKARQPKLDRFVALKILAHDLAGDPAFAERFNREARVLARLSHPNIVTVFDFGSKGPFLFLLMEHIDGVNLRQAMLAGGFPPPDSLALVQDICAALQFAHEEGILHRDIKPENILIDARGRVHIADFGIAKLIGQDEGDDLTLTAKDAVMGSLHYMAPEQIEKPGEVDQRADIYSLGVVFYELLTGELPIGRFVPPSEKTPMDSRVDEVVMRTLEKERERRYQTVEDVKTSVAAITRSHPAGAGQPGETPAPAGVAETPAPPRHTAKFATASAVLTGVSLLLFGATLFGSLLHFANGNQGLPVLAIAIHLMIIVGIPALLGIIFGAKALGEIRESGGGKRGLGRAMFGTLTWPLLVIISLTSISSAMGFMGMFGTGLLWLLCATAVTVVVGVLVILAVWRWARGIPRNVQGHEHHARSAGIGSVAAIAAVIVLLPTLAILVSWGMLTLAPGQTQHGGPPSPKVSQLVDKKSGIDWRLDRPEIELELALAPMHVATIAMVRSDASGKEKILNLRGHVIAPDTRRFQGTIQIGSLPALDQEGKPQWILSIKSSGETFRNADGHIESHGGPRGFSSGDTLSGDWIFDPQVPTKLDLSTPGNHSMIVASPRDTRDGNPRSTDTLTLRVTTLHRSGPGVPDVAINSPIVGGGSIDWTRSLEKLHRK